VTLHEERAKLQARFSELSGDLATIKHLMQGRGRVPQSEYEHLSAKRAALIKEQTDLQSRIAAVKARLVAVADAQHAEHKEHREIREVALTRSQFMAGEIIKLRDRYRSSACDPRMTEAVRHMAQEFQVALSKIVSGDQ
jgi:chromosome segregation ATPase